MQPTPSLSPYLIVNNAELAIAYYTQAFGATEVFRLTDPAGKIGHAELLIGTSRLMLASEFPDFGALGPISIGGTPVSLHLYVEAVEHTVSKASSLGGTVLRPVKLEFYGDKTALIVDPFGHKWHLSTKVETVSPQEMQRRMTAAYA
jgi:PhnB protein